jgi:hypothetical protein
MTERKPRGAWVPAECGGGYDLRADHPGAELVGWTAAWGEWYAFERLCSAPIATGEADTENARRLAVEEALDAAGVPFDLATP